MGVFDPGLSIEDIEVKMRTFQKSLELTKVNVAAATGQKDGAPVGRKSTAVAAAVRAQLAGKMATMMRKSSVKSPVKGVGLEKTLFALDGGRGAGGEVGFPTADVLTPIGGSANPFVKQATLASGLAPSSARVSNCASPAMRKQTMKSSKSSKSKEPKADSGPSS